jgi:hypothetical protein
MGESIYKKIMGSKKMVLFALLFLFFFYNISIFKNWNIDHEFEREIDMQFQRLEETSRYKSEEESSLEATFWRYVLQKEEGYIYSQYSELYTDQPNIFSWIPFQSLRLKYRAQWYNTQIIYVLGNSFILMKGQMTDYQKSESYNDSLRSVEGIADESIDILWKDYTTWLMVGAPTYEEVEKEFNFLPDALKRVVNGKRLENFYENRMERVKTHYEMYAPEKLAYDIKVLASLTALAENDGDVLFPKGVIMGVGTPENYGLMKFEDQDIPYTSYFLEVSAVSLIQALFIFLIYWKMVQSKNA